MILVHPLQGRVCVAPKQLIGVKAVRTHERRVLVAVGVTVFVSHYQRRGVPPVLVKKRGGTLLAVALKRVHCCPDRPARPGGLPTQPDA